MRSSSRLSAGLHVHWWVRRFVSPRYSPPPLIWTRGKDQFKPMLLLMDMMALALIFGFYSIFFFFWQKKSKSIFFFLASKCHCQMSLFNMWVFGRHNTVSACVCVCVSMMVRYDGSRVQQGADCCVVSSTGRNEVTGPSFLITSWHVHQERWRLLMREHEKVRVRCVTAIIQQHIFYSCKSIWEIMLVLYCWH